MCHFYERIARHSPVEVFRGGWKVAETGSCRYVRQQRHTLVYSAVWHFNFQNVCETRVNIYFSQTVFHGSGLCSWVTTGLAMSSWNYSLFSRCCHLRTIWIVGPRWQFLRLYLRSWDEACLFRFVPLQRAAHIISSFASRLRFDGGQDLRCLLIWWCLGKNLGCSRHSAQIFLLKEHICLSISFFC